MKSKSCFLGKIIIKKKYLKKSPAAILRMLRVKDTDGLVAYSIQNKLGPVVQS